MPACTSATPSRLALTLPHGGCRSRLPCRRRSLALNRRSFAPTLTGSRHSCALVGHESGGARRASQAVHTADPHAREGPQVDCADGIEDTIEADNRAVTRVCLEITFSCGAQAPGLSRGESAASCVCAILDAAVASWDALRTIPPPHPSSASGGALPSRKAEPAGVGADARCASPAGRENPLASAMGSVNRLPSGPPQAGSASA